MSKSKLTLYISWLDLGAISCHDSFRVLLTSKGRLLEKISIDEQLKNAHRAILEELYPDSASLQKAATALGIALETARQARDYGKGSVRTINGLILLGLNIHPKDLSKHLPKLRRMFNQQGKLSMMESLIEEARSKYGHAELIAWLRLLLARYAIEKDLGIRKSAGRPPKK